MDSEQEPTTEDARSTQLAEVIARHFAGATIAGQVVALGFADLRIHCRVHAVQQHGSVSSASLFFSLSGGPLGEAPNEEQGLQGDAALRALVTGIKPGGLTVLSSGSEFFARGDLVDPCAGCVALCQRLGLSEDVFPRGALPIQARPAPHLGWLARLRGKS